MKAFIIIPCLLLASFIKLQAQSQQKDKSQVIKLDHLDKARHKMPFDNDYTLVISMLAGTVHIRHAEGNEILARWSSQMKQMPVKIANVDPRPPESQDMIAITSDNTDPTFRMNLFIPDHVKLKISIANTGDIAIDSVWGELELNTKAGKIAIKHIFGSAVASSQYGAVSADFSQVNPNVPMAFSSFAGNVTVYVPESTHANVGISCPEKKFETNFNLPLSKKEGDWWEGKLNGGGPGLILKSSVGRVILKYKRII